MSNPFRKYEIDQKKATEGVEIPIDDHVFICRRAGAGNRQYRAAASLASISLKEQLESKDDSVALEAEDKVTMSAFADAVVVGWKNVDDRNDQPWPFTKENFIELMTACPDLWDRLRFEARLVQYYRKEDAKEVGEALGKS